MCCRHAPPPPHDPPHWRRSRGSGLSWADEGGTRSRGERAARSPSPRRLCPLSRFPSRLQLISHVTFYLLSPGASCPRTVLLRLPRVAPPQPAAVSRAPATLGEAAGGRGAFPEPISAPASGAPGAALRQQGGGLGERAWTQPGAPRTCASRRPAGAPCAKRQERGRPLPAWTRAGGRARPGGRRPGDGRETGVSPPRPRHAEERALQRGARPLPGLPGPQGGHQARLPEQEGSGGEPLAREVVRPLPECALLLRGRAEQPPGGHVPPGGLQLRAGARATQGRGRAGRGPGRAGQAGTTRPPFPVFRPPAAALATSPNPRGLGLDGTRSPCSRPELPLWP